MTIPSFSTTAGQPVGPKVSLDFTTASLDSRITFTRASTVATVFNSSGYVETVSTDVARFQYDPITLACRGLLIEPSRTNVFTYSEDFRNTATVGSTRPWVWNNATVSINPAGAPVSPANTTTANKLIEDSANSTHFLSIAGTNTTGVRYSVSFFAKAAERKFIQVVAQFGSSLPLNAVFNLNTGERTGGLSATTSTITSVGNGWYYITNSVTALTTSASNQIRFFLLDDNGNMSYTGDNASGLYLWGVQRETADFASSYIPTTASQVTRAADVAVMTGTNFSDWYNASKGTFRVDTTTAASGTRPIISADDNTANNNLVMLTDGTSAKFIATNGGSEIANVTGGTVSANTLTFAYASYDANYFGIAMPTARQVDTSGNVPTVDRLRIGANQAGSYLAGIIQRIRFWN